VVGSDAVAPSSRNADGQDQSEEANRLIELLEFEIAQIRSEESRPGWSMWALLGGLATIAWLLTFQIEAGSPNPRNTVFIVLGLSVLHDSLRWVSLLIEGQAASKPARRLEFTHRMFSGGRNRIVLEIGWSVAMIVIAAWFRPLLPTFAVWAAWLFYGAFLLLMLVVLSFSYLKIPTPKEANPPRGAYIFFGALFVLGVVALFGLAGAIWGQDLSPTVNEFRVAGLLAVIIIIVRLLAQGQPRTPLLRTLVDIRRSLGLSKMDVESARRQAEIALAGMTVGEAVQDELGELLSLLEQSSVEIEASATELNAAKSAMPDDMVLSDDDKALLLAVLRSVEKHDADAKAAFDDFTKGYKALTRRLLVFNRVAPGARGDIEELLGKLGAALQEQLAKYTRENEALVTLKTLLESAEDEGEDARTLWQTAPGGPASRARSEG